MRQEQQENFILYCVFFFFVYDQCYWFAGALCLYDEAKFVILIPLRGNTVDSC